MRPNQTVYLTREVEAVLIPSGSPALLPAGAETVITQSLGGSYTVIANGVMARIEGKDLDALGLEPTPPPGPSDDRQASGTVDEKLLWEQLRTCYDPEIPVNIVDLGLIYDCSITPQDNQGSRVDIKMTLTAPGCGMGPAIANDVEQKIRDLPGVADVRVELVWDPPWNQAMMTEAAKLQLGLY